MKITGVEPLAVDAGRAGHLLVFVDTDEGVTGVGEIAMRSWRDPALAAAGHLGSLISGHDPLDSQRLWQLMARGSFFPADGPAAAALAGIDIALWDIKGKCLGVPVYQLLGGQVRDYVPGYAHASRSASAPDPDSATEMLVAECEELAAAGWRHLRWALPSNGSLVEPAVAVQTCVAQAAALRRQFGDDVELLIDVHTRVDLPSAVRLCEELFPYRPFFVEDPLRVENLASYRSLRARSRVPLAAGEQLTSKWGFRELIEDELVDYARIDVGIAGGITEAAKIAAACEVHHVQVATHNVMGPVGTAATLHLALGLANLGIHEQAADPTLHPEFYRSGIEVRGGRLHPGNAPGLGVEVDRDAARARPAAAYHPPTYHRPDGSLSNW